MEAIYKCSSKYTKDEHMRMEKYAFYSSGRAKKVALITGCMTLAAALSMVLLSRFGLLTTKTFFIPCLIVSMAAFVSAVNGPMGRKLAWKMNPGVHDAQQKYYFFAEHFEYHFGENKADIPYEAIYAVGETATNIYIMLNARQGMSIEKRSAPQNLLPFLQDRVREKQEKE